ncbi:MAG: c-type cytochrome [Candidatus Cyclobacteriaceae bacterium M3_2C_046]
MSAKYFFYPILFLLIGIAGCQPQSDRESEKNPLDYRTRIRLKQYMTQGKQLYLQYCSNCHQEDGNGLGALYPPLTQSDYMLADVNRTICIIKNGQQGEIMVNGVSYNQLMPANEFLSDLEIAEIATYMYNKFTDSTLIVTLNQVSDALNNCSYGPVKKPAEE